MGEGQGLSHIYVAAGRFSPGAVGGIFRCPVGGDRWEPLAKGLPEPANVQAITVHPAYPDCVYAGTQDGPYRSLDRGIKAESTMMAVALHQRDPGQVHCVSRTGQVFSTEDGGKTWSQSRLTAGVQDVYAIACG